MRENSYKQTDVKNEMRTFGMSFSAVLVFWGGVLWWKEWQYVPYIFLAAIVFVFVSFAFPLFVRPVHQAAVLLVHCVKWIITKTMLAIIFYCILTPIGIVARLIGKNFLDVKQGQIKDSYWVHRTNGDAKMQRYKNQF